MREKLKTALAAIDRWPRVEVKKSGDYFIATVKGGRRPRRGMAQTPEAATHRALVGSSNWRDLRSEEK